MIYNGKCVGTVGAPSHWQTTITPTNHYEIVFNLSVADIPVHYAVVRTTYCSRIPLLFDDLRTTRQRAHSSLSVVLCVCVCVVHCID